MKKIASHWQIIIGLILGVVWSVISASMGWSKFTMDFINPFGDIFLRLLKLIAVPMVLFSIIKGVSDLSDSTKLGRMGVKTLSIYVFTTVLAVTLGVVLVNLIGPGKFVKTDQHATNRIAYEIWANGAGVPILDGKSYLTDPQYSAYSDKAKAALETAGQSADIAKKIEAIKKSENDSPLLFLVEMVPANIFVAFSENQMLQVIVFAVLFGFTMLLIPKEKAKPFMDFVDSGNEVFIKMVDTVMKGAPYFVFALLAGVMAKTVGNDPKGILEVLKSLGIYSIVVLLGLFLTMTVSYPGLMFLMTYKKTKRGFIDSIKFLHKGLAPAQLMAFSTSSSMATLPVTMECVNDNLKVPHEVSSFVLPIGATVNMDGTSLYQAIAVVFLAQLHMVDLTIAQQITIIITATLASIGTAAVPGAGLIMLIVVLQSVGLNPAWIAIIMPIDRILDMCRTVVNITGDAAVAVIIADLESGQEASIQNNPAAK